MSQKRKHSGRKKKIKEREKNTERMKKKTERKGRKQKKTKKKKAGGRERRRAAAAVPGGPLGPLSPSPIITRAMLGCLPYLHNAILTLLLPPSITGGVSPVPGSAPPSPPDCVLCLSAQAQKIDSPLSLSLMFGRQGFSQNDEAPSQLMINRKHIFKRTVLLFQNSCLASLSFFYSPSSCSLPLSFFLSLSFFFFFFM